MSKDQRDVSLTNVGEITANELADKLDSQEPLGGRDFITKVSTMLRQQAQEIQQLKEDCTCQGGHSEAYLKAKGKL